jgi:hypothetical protein
MQDTTKAKEQAAAERLAIEQALDVLPRIQEYLAITHSTYAHWVPLL